MSPRLLVPLAAQIASLVPAALLVASCSTATGDAGRGPDDAARDATSDATDGDSTIETTATDTSPIFETDIDEILPPDAPLTADSVCAAVASARCTAISTCLPFILHQLYGAVATCRDRLKTRCLSNLSAPGSKTTLEATASCAKAIAGDACSDYLRADPAACFPDPGTLANGAGCWDDAQCASAICVHGLFQFCGSCQPGVGLGASCSSSPCVAGLNCSAGVCVKLGSVGASCSDDAGCAQALLCRAGKCTVSVLGDACNATTKTGCSLVAGLTCSASATCTAAPSRETGGACVTFFDCHDGDCVGGTCTPRLTVGSSCGSSVANCVTPFSCFGGKCALPSATSCP